MNSARSPELRGRGALGFAPGFALGFALGFAAGCPSPEVERPAAGRPEPVRSIPAPLASAPPSPPLSPASGAAPAEAGGGPEAAVGAEEALELLFGAFPSRAAAGCAFFPPERERERVRCLVGAAYEEDLKARGIALGLYDRLGHVAGLDRAFTMDGGYRGLIEIVPERPLGREARHLAWVAAAADDQAAFFAELARRAESAGKSLRYRHRNLRLRFFRSKKKRTPTAYAEGWSVAYNLAGSLNKSEAHVRETLFHELFHLNDADHGDWSAAALGPVHARVVAKCGARTACLGPYAPHETKVVGGTYYAFQPGNGSSEYAAELATRYYDETRRVIAGRRLGRAAFKCGPPENAEAWSALVREFFGGVDLVPPCAPAPGPSVPAPER